MWRFPHRAVAAALCCAFGLVSGCSDSAGPPSPAAVERVELGARVDGVLQSGDSSRTYAIAPVGRIGVIFSFQASSSLFELTVSDSATAEVLLRLRDASGGSVPGTGIVLAPPRVYLVRVLNNGGAGTFWWNTLPRSTLPEWNPALLAFGDTVEERIDGLADLDEFTINSASGDEFVVHFQVSGTPLDTGNASVVTLKLRGPGADTTVRGERVVYGVAQRDLEAGGAEPWTAGAGSYRFEVRLHPSGTLPINAAFRLSVRKLERAPEGRAPAIALGDMVSSALEYNGDVDEYLLAGVAGAEFNVFLRDAFPDSGSGISVTVLRPDGGTAATVASAPNDTALRSATSGTIQVTQAGTYVVRVGPASPYDDRLHRGAYRFYLYPVARPPELAGAGLQLGDTIATETIEDIGDVDEFTLTVATAQIANFVMRRNAPGGEVGVTLAPVGEGTAWMNFGASNSGPTGAAGSGRRLLPAGQYLVRVAASSAPGGYVGPWSLESFVVDTLPEVAAAARAVGDTISGESLERPGDIDLFTFTGSPQQFVELFSQTLQASPYTMNVAAFDGIVPLAVLTTANGLPLSGTRSGRFRLPATGQAAVHVEHQATEPQTPGAYRLAMVGFPTGPETVSAAIAVGDSVTGEGLDTPGDVDEFELLAAPGALLQVRFWGTTGGEVRIEAVANDAVLGAGTSGLGNNATGRFAVPAPGVIRIRVYEAPGQIVPLLYTASGPYSFVVSTVDSLPEGVPPALSPGDTVTESIAPVGDLDVYEVVLTAGDSIRLTLEQLVPFGSLLGPFAELYAPGSDSAMTVTDTSYVGFPTSGTSPPAVAPVSGVYRVRVHDPDQRAGTGSYRLTIGKLN